jgi:hypothetical protein
MNTQQGSRWLTVLVDLWRHTPLSIMMNALAKPVTGRRVRRSIAPETPVSAQMK